MMKYRPKIFTWHIHGSYLFYLSQCDVDIYIPVNEKKTEGYYGRGETFPFGDNVYEIDASEVRFLEPDLILYQTNTNYLKDQYDILTEEQRQLPKIYLEHDPPRAHPTDTRHIIDSEVITLVHVTYFNRLMWDNNGTNAKVIEHGVIVPDIPYAGHIAKGLVVINNLPSRGRLLGLDIFNQVKEQVPLDLVGMGAEEIGLGEVLHPQLPEFTTRYRFLFNPIRYTSLGLAVCEAMMLGIPVVGMATTELSTVIQDGMNGYIHTDITYLVRQMKNLLKDRELAARIGAKGRETALERFNIERFKKDWQQLITAVLSKTNKQIAIYE